MNVIAFGLKENPYLFGLGLTDAVSKRYCQHGWELIRLELIVKVKESLVVKQGPQVSNDG